MTDEPYIDCTRPITQIRPKRGQVLVELLPAPFQIGRILLPPQTKHRAGSGGSLVREMEKYPALEGLIRAFGEPDPDQPFELVMGDRVLCRFYAGRNLRYRDKEWKLLKSTDIEAKFI
jgi:co-chaperonin GroES (HSP10)